MRLKAFDFEQILYEINYHVFRDKGLDKEIKDKLSSHILYFLKDDSIGICLKENKKDIIQILKEYGKTDIAGHFTDIDKFLCTEDYGWDNIILGNYELDADEIWSEFGKLIKKDEQTLLNSGDKFKEEWNNFQKLAIKNIFDEMKNDIMKEIEYAEKDLENRVGMYK